MAMPLPFRQTLRELNLSPRWFRFGSLVLLVLGIGVLFILLRLGAAASIDYSGILLPVLITGIGLALVLFGFYFQILWQKQRTRNRASDAAMRKLASVFAHVLDGIVVLDDDGICLEANPAACDILRVTRYALLGQPFGRFHSDPKGFTEDWRSVLRKGCPRAHGEIRRSDGQTVYVDYLVAADYMPGQHILVFCNTTERLSAEASLRQSEERFRQLADNIQEIFWMMDARTKEVLFVTAAYETVTGYSRAALLSDRVSCREIIHPEDRERIYERFDKAVATGQFDEEFRIRRADGEIRWLWAKTSPRPEGPEDQDAPHWFVGFALDVTARKLAELEAKRSFAAVETAHREADALRKATLALTQNLSMDVVFDTLLARLRDLVPYESAAIILAENEVHLFVARRFPEMSSGNPIVTLKATDTAVLQRIMVERKPVVIEDSSEESDWPETGPLAGSRSWIGVPLKTAKGIFGLLAIGASVPHNFTPDHFRHARSIAVPAAAAIYNARLYEYTVIYSEQLERSLAELKDTQKALEEKQRDPSPTRHYS
jgi:PAS domain S-box-containing protein